MKSRLFPARVAVMLGLVSVMTLLSGCGQKGPLYMPVIPPDPLAPPPAAKAAPARPAAQADQETARKPVPQTDAVTPASK